MDMIKVSRCLILPILLMINLPLAYSQDADREAIVDSMAFGSLNRADLCQAAASDRMTGVSLSPARFEYSIFTYAKNSLSHHYADVDVQGLRKIRDLIVSEPYRKLNSISFWDSFRQVFIEKGMAVFGSIPDFSTKLDDEEYLSVSKELCNLMGLKSVALPICDECCGYVGKAFGNTSPSYNTVVKMKKNIEDILSYVMMDYLSEEEIHFLLDFYRSDFYKSMAKDHALKDVNHFLAVFNGGMARNRFSRYSPGFYAIENIDHMIPALKNISDQATEEDVIKTLVSIRHLPMPFYELYRPSGSVEMDGGLYVGQMRDGKAHGNGTFTAQDGTMYVGSFKNGRLHGFVKKYDADRNGALQIWTDGNLSSEKVETAGNDGLPPVPMIEGWPHGFGLYQFASGVSGGYFVDGRLQGKGFMVEKNGNDYSDIKERTCEGRFDAGVFKEGTVSEYHSVSASHEFKGDVLCDKFRIGECRTWIAGSKDDVKSYMKGTFICDRLEGEGKSVDYINDSLTITKTGFFVMGSLYGPGTRTVTAIMQSGIKSEQLCTGFFWDGEPLKNMTVKETFSGIPVEKGVARIMRTCGVKIVTRGVPELVVECRGKFEDGLLVNGKVTVSDGTWREGHFVKGEHISGRARTVDKYGTVYIGDIRDGRYHGKGKCIYADKTWFEGNFEDGVRKDGVYYNADGVKIKDVK